MLRWVAAFVVLTRYVSSKAPDFGKYHTVTTNLTTCPNSPPDPFEMSLTWARTKSGVDQFVLKYDLPKDIGPIGGSIRLMRWNNRSYVDVIHVKTKNICETFVIGKAIELWPKADSRCYFLKGNFTHKIVDGNRMAHMFLGTSLPYGRYMSKIELSYGKRFLGCRLIDGYLEPAK
ncbi:hypothetical protein EVAR_3543_1 [Eumeta japonica]|uniref:Uncharacterized protein n=1 Tax=Eumeta variegata TaxID=151549 RepID=A0A4C1SVF5_EUMVA|nr:hypothetical protein EVAR_3543_1 [Eumeta japonica]